MMKSTKRFIAIAFALIIILSLILFTASAYSTKTLNTANNTLHMYAYFDYLAGTLVIKNKVWYNANIYGTYDMTGIYLNGDCGDSNCCYVNPGTDKTKLGKLCMYDGKLSVTSGTSGKYVDYTGTYGELKMNLMGTTYTITVN